ncbi:MAG TPA: hypothetical protein VGZ29_13745 [Terriglobia bacterium]|nr:hypothetical protein [Terriglobia bacterium]
MAQGSLGLLFRVNADPAQAQAALELFRTKTTAQMESVRSEFLQVQRGQAEWSSEFLTQSSAVGGALMTLGAAASLTFDRFATALGRNISTALVYSQSMSQALDRALKSTTASIAAEAIVQALRATALGFYLLAVGDFAGAGSAFGSAAVWESIGGVAAGVGASTSASTVSCRAATAGRYGGAEYGLGYGAGTAAVAATGVLAPGAASTRIGGNLTVAIMGDSEAAHWLANTLNQGVAGGVTLTATRTQRSPYAGG